MADSEQRNQFPTERAAGAALERRYTTGEVAKRYGVSTTTVQRWVRNGRLSAINLSGGPYGPYCFTIEDLDTFEAQGRVRGR